jgi:histone H4
LSPLWRGNKTASKIATTMTGGKGLGKAGAVRHRKVLRDNIRGITHNAVKRLARRGGVKRISGGVYDAVRMDIKKFLEKLISHAVLYSDFSHRRTVKVRDVVQALKLQGREMYGF